jgi:hypothetical protein
MIIMNTARKILVGLIAALLLVGLSFAAASRSHDSRTANRLARERSASLGQQKNGQAGSEMTAAEKIVRDVYARLMRYQSAAREQVDAKQGKQSVPDDYLTFELRDFHSGPLQEISNRQLSELATPPNAALITLNPVHLASAGGPQHAYYEAEWAADAGPANDPKSDGAIRNNPRFALFDHYTSYEVRVHLQGKSFSYRALAVYQGQPKSGNAFDKLSLEIIDNVTSGMNTVYSDQSVLARAPWDKYVKTSLYRKLAKALKTKVDQGESLIPKDAPIGYMPGDGEIAMQPIDDGDGGGGGGGGGGEPPCQATTVASLQASLPSTENPVTHTAPAPGIYTTTNNAMAFGLTSTPDIAVVFKSSETQITVTAEGVNPATAASTLHWRVDRDPTDAIDTGTPTLSTLVGPSTIITPNLAGNFRLICYVDLNSNNSYDAGEEQRIMRFAIVQATLETSFIRTTVNFVGAADSVIVNNAMDLSIDILLEGGGANAKVGTDKVVLGDVGNLWATDNFLVSYPIPTPTPAAPANVFGQETENSGGPAPMVDTVNVTHGNSPTGGSTPFRGNSQFTLVSNGPGNLGEIRRVVSLDRPAFSWDYTHPVTTNPWAQTLNGNTFREFIVGYTVTFSPQRNYSVLAVGDWVAVATGNNAGGTWTSAGAHVTIQGGTATSANMTNRIGSDGSPQTGNTGGVQVLGLSFVREFHMDHSP